MAEITPDDVREFLRGQQGQILTVDFIRKELDITRDMKSYDKVRDIVRNLVDQKILSPAGRRGEYKVIRQIKPVKVFSQPRERKPPVEIYFPRDFTTEMEMEFAEHIVIREGDLITVGGVKSSGKTQMSLSFCAENIEKNPVLMGNEFTVFVDGQEEPSPRFLDRLDRMAEWVEWTNGDGEDRFTLLPVHEDFAEQIIPGRFNIIDWINLDANALYDIGKVLKDIKSNNSNGVTLAFLQKGENYASARGGQFVRDFSDLELTLDSFGNNPYDVRLTIKGAKETTKPIVGKSYAYTIGENGTKIFNFREVKKCNGCGGSGKWKGQDCDRCLGTGWQQ